MIAYTIGIGERYKPLAVVAADAARRFYEVDQVVILDESHLEFCPPLRMFRDAARRIFWLKFMISLWHGGRFLYVDADYRPIRRPPQARLDQLHGDERFIAVRDWWPDHPYPWEYRNAGFFVANERHAALFAWCRANYFLYDEVFGDQCCLNRGIATLGVDVLELPRAFNVGKPEQCDEPIAVHGHWHPLPAS